MNRESVAVRAMRCAATRILGIYESVGQSPSQRANDGGGWPILFESRLLKRLPHPSRVLGGRVGSGHEHDSHLFSSPRGPLRFDLDNPFHPRCVVNKAAPFSVLWPRDQPSLYRIAMDVAELFNALRFGPYRKIVIADLPKLRKMFRTQLL